MSVLIKGMEMPTSCRDCRFCNGQADTDYGVCAWCDVDGKARDAYTRQDCPLIPVPAHGRLGDLDELEKTFREDADAEWNRFASPVNWADAFDDVANVIADAPTIIPAEEGE